MGSDPWTVVVSPRRVVSLRPLLLSLVLEEDLDLLAAGELDAGHLWHDCIQLVNM